MREVGLDSPIVWVDVEPVSPPAPWSRSRAANRAVLAGAVAAYRRAGLRVGFYSTPTMWRDIVGRVRYRFPEWRTAGLSTRRAALAKCRRDAFQGGRAVLGAVVHRPRGLRPAVPRPAGRTGAEGVLHPPRLSTRPARHEPFTDPVAHLRVHVG